MAYIRSSKEDFVWGTGLYIARRNGGPSINDPAALLGPHWEIAITIGAWTWHKTFAFKVNHGIQST